MILDESALRAWGERLGAVAPRPAFIALRGELGSGKSVLARAIARGAGVASPMPSPTFNLLMRYEGDDGVIVSHLDLYRLDRPEDVHELGWFELGQDNEIVLVEWADRASSLLPPRRWEITLQHTDAGSAGDAGKRAVSVESLGGAPPLPAPDMAVP